MLSSAPQSPSAHVIETVQTNVSPKSLLPSHGSSGDDAVQEEISPRPSLPPHSPSAHVVGSLVNRLARIKTDLDIYEEAKKMIDSGKLASEDQWWKDHESALNRAQARYGELIAPQSSAVVPLQAKSSRKKKQRLYHTAASIAFRSKGGDSGIS